MHAIVAKVDMQDRDSVNCMYTLHVCIEDIIANQTYAAGPITRIILSTQINNDFCLTVHTAFDLFVSVAV